MARNLEPGRLPPVRVTYGKFSHLGLPPRKIGKVTYSGLTPRLLNILSNVLPKVVVDRIRLIPFHEEIGPKEEFPGEFGMTSEERIAFTEGLIAPVRILEQELRKITLSSKLWAREWLTFPDGRERPVETVGDLSKFLQSISGDSRIRIRAALSTAGTRNKKTGITIKNLTVVFHVKGGGYLLRIHIPLEGHTVENFHPNE